MRLSARPVQPGRYDLVLLPTHLWLTIHESIAHPTELDRIFGYEANYAGTSFISPPADFLGRFRYGPEIMNVQGERSSRGGLSTVGFDDEGVATRNTEIIRDGVLVGVLPLDGGDGEVLGLRQADGSLRWLLVNTQPQTAADGTVLEVLVSWADVTGLPWTEVDFAEDLAGQRTVTIDRAGFERAMEEQRAAARKACFRPPATAGRSGSAARGRR
mgnify:CR=1 FL=1